MRSGISQVIACSDKAIGLGGEQAVMMSITLAVSIDYSLFILSRYREEIIQGLEVEAAVEQSLGTAGHTVLVSGTTLAVSCAAPRQLR